ncbi:MAG: hypothetical protein ACKPCM_04765 [Pseudanabaena sp.]
MSLPFQHGYANFGFKAISTTAQKLKYSDQNLYAVTPKFKLQNSETQHLDYSFDLIQSFLIQKAGNAITECEDIWHYTLGDRQISIALSDGATESSFAKEWAKELVTAFVNRDYAYRHTQNPKVWLHPVQQTWQQWLGKQNLTWFAKRKADAGTFATFLGLEIWADLNWNALATGDSCLFIVRNHQSHLNFPLQSSHEFNHQPRLIGTYTEQTSIQMHQASGVAELGDRFYLTTDAIACWIFKQLEASQDPWIKLGELRTEDHFAQWVQELRDRHEIANDDTTLLCLEIRRES